MLADKPEPSDRETRELTPPPSKSPLVAAIARFGYLAPALSRCQRRASADWRERRRAAVLPVIDHHLVFTLPDTLNGWVEVHPEVIDDLLFEMVWATLCMGENGLALPDPAAMDQHLAAVGVPVGEYGAARRLTIDGQFMVGRAMGVSVNQVSRTIAAQVRANGSGVGVHDRHGFGGHGRSTEAPRVVRNGPPFAQASPEKQALHQGVADPTAEPQVVDIIGAQKIAVH